MLVDVLLIVSIARGSDSISSTTQKIDMPSREACIAQAKWYNDRKRMVSGDTASSGTYWGWQIAYDATCVQEKR